MTDPLTIAMCKDMLRHIYALQGTAFIESELAYYKAFEARRFPAAAAAPVPAPPAPTPAPPPAVILHAVTPPPLPIRPAPTALCTVKKEEAEVVAVASVPAVVVAEAAAGAGAGAGAAPVVAENKVIVAPTEKTRYKRTELPDEERCIDVTARGTRCTLGRHEESDYCQRHLKKHSS